LGPPVDIPPAPILPAPISEPSRDQQILDLLNPPKTTEPLPALPTPAPQPEPVEQQKPEEEPVVKAEIPIKAPEEEKTSNADKAILDLLKLVDTTPKTQPDKPAQYTSPARFGEISQTTLGGSNSASAFGGADVAMLGDTSVSGIGSKVSKKGGKYPWGEPEGTTALKQGLGI
jgi:hypothetical protein